MQNIQSLKFSLYDLERSIAKRDFAKFEEDIILLLQFVDHRYPLESVIVEEDGTFKFKHTGLIPFHDQMLLHEKQDLYSRLAHAITAYLSDTSYRQPDEILLQFLAYKAFIGDVFYLSCYGNMDHILFNRELMDANLSLALKTETDIKLLYACITLNTEITFDPEQLIEAIPSWGRPWYLGLMYNRHHFFNARMEATFNKLFDHYALVEQMDFDNTCVELASSPWMLCSYLDRPDRHAIKVSINKAIQKWISRTPIPPGTLKRVEKNIQETSKVKRIVVLSEHYKSNHAMYRCYHPEIKRLKEHFHLTLVSASNRYDEKSRKDFHEVIDIEDTAGDFVNTVNKIAKTEPDLIFFPSLGMAKWTIPFANMRLAKYQLMCFGHPASAMSEFIDYSASSKPKEDWNFQQFCLEKLVPVYQGDDFIWEPYPGYEPKDYVKPNDGVVRIAVNSSLPKITSRFMNLCALILQHSSVSVEFNFFLIVRNDAFEKSAYERLGASVRVHPPAEYEAYMENLAACDLAIGTFPFGGSNTNTDVSLLGIPKIFYSEACGLASYSDQTALEKMDLPEILKPKSEAELLANLIYLIHDANQREEISQHIKASNPFQTFYKQKTDKNADEACHLVEVVNWIEENDGSITQNMPDSVNQCEETNLVEPEPKTDSVESGAPNDVPNSNKLSWSLGIK